MTDFIKALTSEALALEAALASDPRYIKLQEVKRLCALYGAHIESNVSNIPGPLPPRPAPRPISSGVGLEAINVARAFLAKQNKPVLTRDLLTHLEGLGVQFGGSSAQATLASILSRTPDFESKGGRVGWVLKSVGSTGGNSGETVSPPAATVPPSGPVEPEAGGGT